MRQIGTIADEGEAKALGDYLLTLNIPTKIDPSSKGGFAVWVRREDQVERARGELEAFLRDPADVKYQGAALTAKQIRKRAEKLEREHRKNTVELGGRWSHRSADRIPVTLGLVAVSVVVFLMTEAGAGATAVRNRLYVASARIVVDADAIRQAQQAGVDIEPFLRRQTIRSNLLSDLRRGEVWRPITPIFLHFDIWHIVLNMLGFYDLGGLIEMRRGTWRMALLVLVTAIASNLAQYYVTGSPFFGGMSGVVCGLFGFVWMRSRYMPEQGMRVDQNSITFFLVFLAACSLGLVGRIANVAHFTGLGLGMLAGAWPHLRRQFLR